MTTPDDLQSEHRPVDDPKSELTSRRRFVGVASGIAMAGGLAAGYGTLAVMAGRFLFPARDDDTWMFVTVADEIPPGESMPFKSATGIEVVVTRRAGGDPALPPSAEDFLALSSVCPHLGCRVHWEPQNDRYFCPCHHGTFDPQGNPTGGPPAEDNTPLPAYPLQVDNGLLYIELPIESLVSPEAVADSTALVKDGNPSPGERLI